MRDHTKEVIDRLHNQILDNQRLTAHKPFFAQKDIPFETTEITYRGTPWFMFRVGTCEGLWRPTEDAFEILAVVNREKGNGHFRKALWWFEQSCIRDNKALRICEVWNPWLWLKCWKHGYKLRGLFTWEKRFD